MWKNLKIMLITHTFPHYPQGFPQAENPTFSCTQVNIIKFDKKRQTPHFFAHYHFDNMKILFKKFPLDSILSPQKVTASFFRFTGSLVCDFSAFS